MSWRCDQLASSGKSDDPHPPPAVAECHLELGKAGTPGGDDLFVAAAPSSAPDACRRLSPARCTCIRAGPVATTAATTPRSSRSKRPPGFFWGTAHPSRPPLRSDWPRACPPFARAAAGGAAHGYPTMISGSLGSGRRARYGDSVMRTRCGTHACRQDARVRLGQRRVDVDDPSAALAHEVMMRAGVGVEARVGSGRAP